MGFSVLYTGYISPMCTPRLAAVHALVDLLQVAFEARLAIRAMVD